MLAAIRSLAKSWVVKVLLGLLVVSFAIWGIGDVFTGGSSNVVARVGDHTITASELDEAFRRRLQQLQRQSPQPIGRADAIRFGLLDDTLQGLAAQRLIEAEAERLRMVTADDTVARLIMAEPAFQTEGRFDRQRFEALLRQSGLDERRYTEELRSERTRDALVGALRPIGNLPTTLTDPLTARIAEARSGRLLVALAPDPATVGVPDDATLEAHRAANEGRFQAPERRDLTAILLSPELIAAETSVDDAELEEAYTAALDRFTRPETRTVRQLRGDDETALRDAYTALRNGEDADAVAERLAGVALSTLGTVEEAALPEAFAAPIFSAAGAGTVTPPVQSAFGWHVFIVDAVNPPATRPFAEVRDELQRDLARERAAEELPALGVALDDAIGGGASLEEAAATLALPLVRASGVDPAGRGPDGAPVASLDGWGPLLVEAFAAVEGETSLLQEIDGGHAFVVRVDAVRPAHAQTLDEARAAVLADWQAGEARRLAQERATAARERLLAGDPAAAVVAGFGLVERPVARQTRADRSATPALIDALFETAPGAMAEAVVEVADGVAVLLVDAETAIDAAVAEATRAELQRGFAQDILVQYEAALRTAHPLTVDRRALARFFPVE